MAPVGKQAAKFGLLGEGAPEEDGATILKGSVASEMAMKAAKKIVAARGSGEKKIVREVNGGRRATTERQSRTMKPKSKREGRAP